MRRPRMLILALVCGLFPAVTATSRAGDPAAPPASKGKAKILVLTGAEHPSHNWRETAPWIAQFLATDSRLSPEVKTDPQFLASPKLLTYDAIALNYINWKSPDPGEPARGNLKRFVENGKGLVLVHFACGAFLDWPEFKEIAGRAWNPNRLRGHDPYGPFRVEFTRVQHPITQGLQPFETTDELYTCLHTSGRPVDILARATSKVDGKVYPLALANHYGRGRVFLCLLGHDRKALEPTAVQELYRRGTAWASGLPPPTP